MNLAEIKTYLSLHPEAVLVDVRSPEHYQAGHLEGAINMPLATLSERQGELSMAQPVIVYCNLGITSQKAMDYLQAAGFEYVMQLEGGLKGQGEHE